jgi:hypothetical protein
MVHANSLRFLEMKGDIIGEAPPEELRPLQECLERDFRLLSFLMAHSAHMEIGGVTLEQRLLMLDFRLMRVLCSMGRLIGTNRVRAALREMATILHHLANEMGERIEAVERA